ncbi:c-type cytochrome [uncultured Thiodictyon sp.]|uniref:c-type cytochrome n=1 Tax=uncultured Thiodictyon sp. TaxID=1846217 RepID=UPI0025F122D1|nr:c-type cytochrome [uncultured Thiodictyon sp.]
MKNNWLKTISAVVLVAGGVSGTVAANTAAKATAPVGDAKAGEEKAGTICIACHGPLGNSVNPVWPKLAGQHPEYIYKQLMDFKSGARQNVLMTTQAAALTDQDVLNAAAYFSQQKQDGGAADPTLAKQGEVLYRGGNPETGVPACSGCHGPAGLGAGLAKFPRISGQHADYVSQTLGMFRSGTRANDPNGMMRGVAARLTDQEIAAVAQYVQGLGQ